MSATAEMRQESLMRARCGQSMANYPAIFAGFTAMGIPESEIDPRENVLTYNAWIAAGRQVRKGQHGVKLHTWVNATKEVSRGGSVTKEDYRFCRSATVFHVSQTDAIA